MMQSFDVLLIDLQDVGCRVYTFITTLRYVLEAAAKHRKAVWVLDRPNPAGRPVEGTRLRAGWESFVGAGALPMRHGLTMGELARRMRSLAPQWLQGCGLRECWFEPTFHKHVGKLCAGLQIHAEAPLYGHEAFHPWRLMAAAFKALRSLLPQYPLWRDFE